jgi:hypothetical protein
MRSTLDIDDDLLRAAKELARRQGVSTGRVVSQLMRSALLAAGKAAEPRKAGKSAGGALGFRPLMTGQALVTNDEVNRLRDAEGV